MRIGNCSCRPRTQGLRPLGKSSVSLRPNGKLPPNVLLRQVSIWRLFFWAWCPQPPLGPITYLFLHWTCGRFPLIKLLIRFAVQPVIIQSVWWPCPSVSLASKRNSASLWAAAIAWEGRHLSFYFFAIGISQSQHLCLQAKNKTFTIASSQMNEIANDSIRLFWLLVNNIVHPNNYLCP